MDKLPYNIIENHNSPKKFPQPPYGPTSIEVMRSCPLRVCFEASPGYERRLGFAARVGTAFHRVMESFNEYPLPTTSQEDAVEEARLRYQREIQHQIEEAASHPREVGLPHDQNRIDRALEAIVIEARRIYEIGGITSRPMPADSNLSADNYMDKANAETPLVEVEVPVVSTDGLIHGKIDRVEHRPDGIWLFDFKSALRDDLPDRYERQLQLYAFLWHQTRNEWPVAAYVVYPLASTSYEISIEPEKCINVANEALQLIQHLPNEIHIDKIATPGDVCQVCDYRPWCQPFWQWQGGQSTLSQALADAEWGFEGSIQSIDLDDHHWRLKVLWHNSQVQLIAPEERFPYLTKAKVGVGIKVLDTPLRGLRHQPHAIISPRSEIFLIHKD